MSLVKDSFILKLPHSVYRELPENEDLTMKMASCAGLEVPFHGMIYAMDGCLIYFIKRFDREGSKKCSVEDFGQLTGLSCEAKYDFSMEKLVSVIDQFCTNKSLEKAKLFRLVLFNFLIGNEDAHVKNFSLIRKEGITKLAPAYDLVNSTIVIKGKEEIALTLKGEKSNLKQSDFFSYFGQEKLTLSQTLLDEISLELQNSLPAWK